MANAGPTPSSRSTRSRATTSRPAIETVDGVPLREGFAPAPPPGFVAEVLVEEGITEGVDL